MRRSRALTAVLLASGCQQATSQDSQAEAALPSDPPEIQVLSWSCDAAAATWDFQVETRYWTGGGTVWMARDPDRVERHRVPSVSAEADGSADRLELGLDVVADWRYAVSGSSTAWRCAEADRLSFQVAVYTVDGDRADCRTWGADPALWSRVDDVADCETVLEVEDTG